MKRDDYLAKRSLYAPDHARLVIVAESPPASGKYFYVATPQENESVFRILVLLCVKPYHRDQRIVSVGKPGQETYYFGPRTAPSNLVIYRDRPSKSPSDALCSN